MAKGLKLKVRKFWWLIPTFVEVTGEKLVGGPFCPLPPSPRMLNRINPTETFKPTNTLGEKNPALSKSAIYTPETPKKIPLHQY